MFRPLEDVAAAAARAGVSPAAIELCWTSEIVDLHIDTFIPPRLWGHDPLVERGRWPFGRHFFTHLDVPRMRRGGLTAAMWSITTNPWRQARWPQFLANVQRMQALVARSAGQLAFARTRSEYDAVRARGAHAVLLSVQGGNALDGGQVAEVPDGLLTRVTLVHLTNSGLGTTSSPGAKLRRRRGLTDAGRALIEQLNAARVWVDLAHIHPDGFWDALEVHATDRPPIVTHTGVDGVRPHWRNLDDRQIRAIADRGGVVGIMAHLPFLAARNQGRDGRMLVAHMQHVIDVAGEDAVALGTDYDGAISPPADLASGDVGYPRLVQHMLDAGWHERRIRKVLGLNYLRSWGDLRP
jgi:membrane dipeptidase